jgi:hypothetical protein
MTRTMFDFTGANLGRIPAGASIYASYGNGKYAVDEEEFARQFPDAIRLLIDVLGTAADRCQIADVEQGDLTIATAIQWIQSYKVLHGKPGTVYGSRDTMDALVPAASGAGQLAGFDYHIWLATLDGSDPQRPGVIGVQDKTVDNLYDHSVIYDDNWYPGPVTLSASVNVHVTSADGGEHWAAQIADVW